MLTVIYLQHVLICMTDAAHTYPSEIKNVFAHGFHEHGLSQPQGSSLSCQHDLTPDII